MPLISKTATLFQLKLETNVYTFDMSIPFDQCVNKLDNDKAPARSKKGGNQFKGARRRIKNTQLKKK